MTIPYVLLAKNFGPHSVCHANVQLFAVGRGFETRPGLQLKNSLKSIVNPAVNRCLIYRRMTACTWVWIGIWITQFDRHHMKLAFISAYSAQTESSLLFPSIQTTYSSNQTGHGSAGWSIPFLFSARFRLPSGDVIHCILMLLTLFDLPVVTSKTSLTTIFHYIVCS